MVGGGSLPGGSLPTRLVSISGSNKSYVRKIAEQLRSRETPVIGRISEDALLLDPRTVLPEEDPDILQAFRELSG